jgi:hypothetical protein
MYKENSTFKAAPEEAKAHTPMMLHYQRVT